MAFDTGPFVRIKVGWVNATRFDGWRRVGSADAAETQIVFDAPVLGAPGGAAYVVDTTAPIGVPLWYRLLGDNGETTGVFGPYTLPALGTVWLTDPARPWANLRMDVCPPGEGHRPGCETPDPGLVWGGFQGAQDTAADATLLPIHDAERPADIFARRKYATGSFRFFSRTLAAIDQVYTLFTVGGPLLLRVPDVYGQRDIVIQPGTVSMSYVSRDQRRPERVWDVPYTVVDAPQGPAQGTECNNWCAVGAAFPTFADLSNYPATWGDLMAGDVLCPDTPPGEDGFGLGPFGSGPYGDGG